MPNHPSIIARPSASGFTGRYVHNDGDPSIRVSLLRTLHAGPFGGDVKAMSRFLLDEHPAGWSRLGDDPTADTGFINWHLRPASSTTNSVTDRGFRCYCHGERGETPLQITEADVDADLADWVYVLHSDGIDVLSVGARKLRQTKRIPWVLRSGSSHMRRI